MGFGIDWRSRPLQHQAIEQLLVLAGPAGVTVLEISDICGLSCSTVQDHLHALDCQGLADEWKDENHLWRWRLVPQP